jgi:DNA-binding transcriptional MocR family regulator
MSRFKYQQLANELLQQISARQWQAGEKLPSVRWLCQHYQRSLATVQHALHLLEAEGVIEAKSRAGYFVKFALAPVQIPQFSQHIPAPNMVTVPDMFFDIMNRSGAFDILPSGPQVEFTHLNSLMRHIGRALRQQPFSKAMYYDEPLGLYELRLQITEHYRSTGLVLDTQSLCITAGCQHALFLALKASCKPGDTVAVECPAFYGVLQLLQELELKALEIPTSPGSGLDVDSLEQALENWQISACVVTPAFATPTGACMPATQQAKLISLANKHDFAVIEDDIYGDLGFHQRPKPLKSLDTQDRVMLCSSFSKSLSRDLRIGWIAAGRWSKAVARLKLVSQLASSQAMQQGIASFMAEGHYKRHLNQYRQQLKHQRDQLINCLQHDWASDIQYTTPQGGLALWLQLDKGINCQQLYLQCLERGIILTPGVMFSNSNNFNHYLRLSFAHPIVGSRKNALAELGRMLLQMPAEQI